MDGAAKRSVHRPGQRRRTSGSGLKPGKSGKGDKLRKAPKRPSSSSSVAVGSGKAPKLPKDNEGGSDEPSAWDGDGMDVLSDAEGGTGLAMLAEVPGQESSPEREAQG
jgi:hypothetical protein